MDHPRRKAAISATDPQVGLDASKSPGEPLSSQSASCVPRTGSDGVRHRFGPMLKALACRQVLTESSTVLGAVTRTSSTTSFFHDLPPPFNRLFRTAQDFVFPREEGPSVDDRMSVAVSAFLKTNRDAKELAS